MSNISSLRLGVKSATVYLIGWPIIDWQIIVFVVICQSNYWNISIVLYLLNILFIQSII